jgi:hypothetical protein
MLARFSLAITLAVLLAVLCAAGHPAAQAPQAQKPVAAAEQKPPKAPKAWPPDAETLKKQRLEAEALPLFASQDPVEIVLGPTGRRCSATGT